MTPRSGDSLLQGDLSIEGTLDGDVELLATRVDLDDAALPVEQQMQR